MAFFLPPFGAGEGGGAALDGAGECEGGAADFGEAPARVNADVDMHAAGAAGLGPAAEPEFFEEGFYFEGNAPDVGPLDARSRVEVDAEFIGVVEIAGADRVRMQFHAAEIDDPGEAGGVIDDDFFGGAAGGEGEGRRAEPVGMVGGCALLVEGLGFGSVDEALEDDGAVANAEEGAGGDGLVVTDEVELGELEFAGEVKLVGVGDADVPTVDGKGLSGFFFFHQNRLHLRVLWDSTPF